MNDVNTRDIVIDNRWTRQNIIAESFSMMLVMIRSSKALLFMVLFSIRSFKSYLLRISLHFQLILSFRVYMQRMYTILDGFAGKKLNVN